MKYIIVTGSVMSGIGKGITASSIGVVLQKYGLRVTAIKIDPYLNLDSGTMSPFEHGECYVLNDGGETDLDLGNYERFLGLNLTKDHNITTGKIYQKVLNAERHGDYLGKTVQVVPHITNEIQSWIEQVAKIPVDSEESEPEVCIIELGGTIGDIESTPFIEALRQLIMRVGQHNAFVVNVSYVPVLKTSDETKTKPVQHGIQQMRMVGLSPDLLCVRCERELTEDARNKLSIFCGLRENQIVMNPDVENIYQIPVQFDKANLFELINYKLELRSSEEIVAIQKLVWDWNEFTTKISKSKCGGVTIIVVGKYTGLVDSYLSLSHAIKHAAYTEDIDVNIKYIDADRLLAINECQTEEEKEMLFDEIFDECDGIIIPGGFGYRGIEGMVIAAQYAREYGIPCLGICLGFQVQVIEFARNVAGLTEANSTEFDHKTPHPVITIINPDEVQMGGTMRLGLKPTEIKKGTQAYRWAKGVTQMERHRHRYEVNPMYIEKLEKAGFVFSGKDPTGTYMEIGEVKTIGDLESHHPFYLGTQYHGEYLTRPNKPSPYFHALVHEAFKYGKLRDE